MPKSAKADVARGKRLGEAMLKAGIRPGELAKAEGVQPSTVSRWLQGKGPDELRLPQLARRLGVPLKLLKPARKARMSWGSQHPRPERRRSWRGRGWWR
jgi:transcriptional regulator with XRE-family HTH domain